VIEPPAIDASTIEAVLRDSYGIAPARAEFLPVGHDSSAWSYRVHSDGRSYYLKIRGGSFKPVGPLMPRFLHSLGLENVIPPLPTADGHAWVSLNDLHYTLYPFVEGRPGRDVGLSDAQWRTFGSFLRRLHAAILSPELHPHVPRDQFSPPHLAWITDFHVGIHQFDSGHPLGRELRSLWLDHRDAISRLIQRTRALAARMRTAPLAFVLCHADIHTANTLVDAAGVLFVVDWDDTVLAPAERDLTYILAEAEGTRLHAFGQGYGEVHLDPLAQAYYRHLWCLEDLAVDAENTLAEDRLGARDRRNALDWFKFQLAPGSTADAALAMPIPG